MTPNNFRVKSGLTVGTTISGGNTTITGFVNASSTVNASGLAVGTAFVANSTGAYHTGTVNAASFTVGATVVANSTAVYATRLNSKTEANLNVNAATFSNTILVPDTRAVATTPETTSSPQVRFDFKQNTTDGLSDGGTYFGEMSFRPYGSTTDWSGGPAHQLGFTSNNNLYHRSGNSTTWGSWGRLYKEGTILTPGANVVLGSVGVSANGAFGTAGHVLHSNGTATYWAADDQGVTSVATANGLSGGTITSTGTIGVTTGSTLTVNTTGIHVNSALSITDLVLSGNLTVSGTTTYVNSTTLNVGDNIVTLNADVGGAVAPTENAGIEINRGSSANVQFLWDETNDRWSTNGQPLAISSLVAAGAASGITTLAAGNTSITGFVNASASVNSAILAVGTSFIANTTGAYHTGTVNAASHTVGTAFVANSTQTTFGHDILVNNTKSLRFQTVNTSAYAYFTQQNDDNFVFYTSNTTYGARAVFSVYANSATSNLSIAIPLQPTSGIVANGSLGTAGQLLTSNGTSVYWSSPGASGVNTAAQYTWTNTHTFSANVAFGNSIGIPTGNSTVSGGMIFFGGLADANWKMGRNTNGTTKWYYTNNTIDILAANSNLEGIVLGNSLVSGKSYFETGHAGTYIASNVTIGNTTSNSTINSTAISIDQVLSTNNGNGTNFKVGDDAWIGDINTADTLTIRGQQSANNGYIVFGNADTTTKLGRAGTGALTYNGAFAVGNTTVTGFAAVSSARGAVATPTAGQNNSALYVTGSDTAYGLLFGVDPATGRGWIQSQRTDGTATTYSLRLNPAGGITEFGAGYTEAEVANTAATGAWTMNCAAANFFELTLTGSITISPSNVPANGRVWSGTIVAKQDATGGRTITWPSGTKWPGGSAPPATTTANAIDIWSLMTYDGGSTWVGSLTVKNVA